jgi:hypothetical protein
MYWDALFEIFFNVEKKEKMLKLLFWVMTVEKCKTLPNVGQVYVCSFLTVSKS